MRTPARLCQHPLTESKNRRSARSSLARVLPRADRPPFMAGQLALGVFATCVLALSPGVALVSWHSHLGSHLASAEVVTPATMLAEVSEGIQAVAPLMLAAQRRDPAQRQRARGARR
jgi:hypothetical protein